MRCLIEPRNAAATPRTTGEPGMLPRTLALVLMCVVIFAARVAPTHADFVVNAAKGKIASERLSVTIDMELDLSDEAEEALDRGIPLIVSLRMALERDRRAVWNKRLVEWRRDFEISFHALSQRYVVQETGRGGLKDYPTAQDAMRAIGGNRTIIIPVPGVPTNPDLNYEVEVRARLEIESLPTPLRLMAYLSPAWRLSTGSSKWPVQH